MSDRETLPINHSTGSHIAHTVGGAAVGAAKGALVVGTGLAVTALFLLGGGIGALIGGLAFEGAWLLGAGIGAVAAPVAVPVLAVIASGPAGWLGLGAAAGGIAGAAHGHNQVQRDRAAAHMVDAEVGAMQAQAVAMQAQAQMLAHTRPGDRYAGASTMIQTRDTQLDAATAASQGMVGAPQLEAARG